MVKDIYQHRYTIFLMNLIKPSPLKRYDMNECYF